MELLEYHPDLSALFPQGFPFKGGDFRIPDPYPPPVRSFQQINAPDQRGFSGPWISDYAEDFSFFYMQAYLLNGLYLLSVSAEGFADILKANHVWLLV